VSPSEIYASGLALLGAWGLYAVRKPLKASGDWTWRRRRTVLVETFFILSCFGCAAVLWTGHFQAWMAALIGLSYLLMIPLPCYFEWVNRVRWVHAVRDFLFIAVALVCFAIAAGFVPLSVLGLS
jgi:hypothetical protein